MNEHSTRLQGDLDRVRELVATASEDDRFALAEVLTSMSQNLPKAKRCESERISIADLNALLQSEADKIGEPYTPVPVPQSSEVDTLREHLTHCRGLLSKAIADSSVKEIRRIVSLIIRSEKNLSGAMIESGQYVDFDFCRRASRAFVDSIGKSDETAWASRVDAHLDASGFKLETPKGTNQ